MRFDANGKFCTDQEAESSLKVIETTKLSVISDTLMKAWLGKIFVLRFLAQVSCGIVEYFLTPTAIKDITSQVICTNLLEMKIYLACFALFLTSRSTIFTLKLYLLFMQYCPFICLALASHVWTIFMSRRFVPLSLQSERSESWIGIGCF